MQRIGMDIESVVAQLRKEINSIEAAISALEGLGQTKPRRGRPPKSAQTASAPRKRHMSAAARAKIAAAQRARWAKQKAGAAPKKAAKKTGRGPRHMSAAARKKLSALMKARWAARKKA
jgi:hypothetical protein